MPPYWALGFQLCKYGYNSLDNLRLAVDRTREAGIPHVGLQSCRFSNLPCLSGAVFLCSGFAFFLSMSACLTLSFCLCLYLSLHVCLCLFYVRRTLPLSLWLMSFCVCQLLCLCLFIFLSLSLPPLLSPLPHPIPPLSIILCVFLQSSPTADLKVAEERKFFYLK